MLEGVLDYQRSIINQMAILKKQIDQNFFNKVLEGNLNEVTSDQLQCFLSVYPRDQEIK